MCGICGRFGSVHAAPAMAAALESMTHRGPDQAGQWSGSELSLGHRRLSIVDLSDNGRQPMRSEDGRIQLVFNGEVYNFGELRKQLEHRHTFRSRTDTEVLIHGYEEWGIEGLLTRIRGMFAFALWDERGRVLHLVRDHMGKKPLFYRRTPEGIAFASTLPALVELLGETPEVSRRALIDYLTYMCVPAPHTVFEGVMKLMPAHRLEFRPGSELEVFRYWQPEFGTKETRSEGEWVERIEAALRGAVQERLVADVPLGAFLSGGIDSSLVVAFMAQAAGSKVTTISMGFEEQAFNELPFARLVADAYATNHHEHVLQPNAAATLPALVYHYGEPFADYSALPTFYVAQVAKQHVTVVLTGDGGDECFGGYHTATATALASYARFLPGVGGGLAASLLRRVRGSAEASGLRKVRWVAELASRRGGNYVFDPVGRKAFRFYRDGLLGQELADFAGGYDSDERYRELWEEAGVADWVDRALYVDLKALLPDDMLVKVDVATMAHSLEARSPFLDKRIVELAATIPSNLKIRGLNPKHLLKKLAEKHLPREVFDRRKQGFAVPVSDWFRGDLRGILEEVLLADVASKRGYLNPVRVRRLIDEHTRGTADHGQRLWMLLILELWFRMFIDGELRPSDDLADVSLAAA